MQLEGRRTIAIIVTLLFTAGGIGAFLVNESRVSPPAEEAAATAADTTEPTIAAAVRPTVAPAQEASVEAAAAQPPTAEPLEAEPVVAEPVVAETVVAEPVLPEPATPAALPEPDMAGAAEPAAEPEVAVAAVEPAAPAGQVVARPMPEAPAPAPAVEVDRSVDGEADADAAVFDLVRVEPTGDAVIAGRARAGATVELLRNGERHDIIVADASGAFAFIPPPLPPGTHEIALRIQEADGTARRGRQSVTVVVAETMDTAPVVALAEPGAPTRVLSQPEPPAPEPAAPEAPVAALAAADQASEGEDVAAEAAEPPVQVAGADAGAPLPAARAGVRIASVEAESGGGLYVSGEAGPEAGVRLYLNETFVGAAAADGAGAVSFAIGSGVRPGVYRVRLDEVGGADGAVLSRAEVTFEMPALPETPAVAAAPEVEAREVEAREPAAVADAATDAAEPAPRIVAEPAPPAAPAQEAAQAVTAVTTTEPPISAEGTGEVRTATLTIPAVNTALVVRGDSLWRISRRIYGDGIRYTVIFDANQDQIRNPDLIFPGQVFVLPAQEPAPAPAAADARGG